jgi:membrane dipeptidase
MKLTGSNGGVSEFGAKVIGRLNDLGIVVDTAHCNEQTVLDACKISERTVIASHTAAFARFAHDRGISDRAAEAIAATGGIIGVVAVPFFLGRGTSTIETMLDHIDHFVSLVGWQHVAIATDWPLAPPKWVLEKRTPMLVANGFRKEHGITPAQNLVGFDDYRDFPNITRGLVENFIRVFGEVCG